MKKQKLSLSARIKEYFRRTIVALKRKPHMIPLCVLLAAFLWYSLQLTKVSNATASINGSGMGLCGFVTMLFSILGIVCYGNAFPHRKKVNKLMLGLMILMFAAVVYADIRYLSIVRIWVYRELSFNNSDTFTNNWLLYDARQVARMQTKSQIDVLLNTHVWILSIGLVLTALLPVYSKLLKKIDTSVDVEGNANMSVIDISGDD